MNGWRNWREEEPEREVKSQKKSNSKEREKRRWGDKESKRERKSWKNCNGKMWNNGEKKNQRRRGMVGRRVTIG